MNTEESNSFVNNNSLDEDVNQKYIKRKRK
jgi:hypothetical protein